MAKKFGKFLLFSLLAGAAAAGVYYFLKDRDDEDLFEDSEPDVNDDLEEFLKKESENGPDTASKSDAGSEGGTPAVPEDKGTASEEKASEETASEETASEESTPGREYVPLNFSKEAVEEAGENIIGTPAREEASPVEKASETAGENVSSFSFSSFE